MLGLVHVLFCWHHVLFNPVWNLISPPGRANIDSTCHWFTRVEKFVCTKRSIRCNHRLLLFPQNPKSSTCGWVGCSESFVRPVYGKAVSALNLHWAHLCTHKNRFKYCRPEPCSDCPPNISINKSLWCSWRPNNNYNRVLLISLRVPLLRSAGLVCLELFERRAGIPLVYNFT